jgi:hypothetical protein
MEIYYSVELEFDEDKEALECRALANETSWINELLEQHGVSLIDDFTVQDFSSFAQMANQMDVSLGDLTSADETWYDIQEGQKWVKRVIKLVGKQAPVTVDTKPVLEELDAIAKMLNSASDLNKGWRMQILS